MKRVALISRVQWGLEALHIMLQYRSKGLDICAVFTLPEEESCKYSNYVSFKDVCFKNALSLIETLNINDEIERIKELRLDYIFIFGWSQLLRQELLELPKYGCINSHPTRLPGDRGRAPVTWQLIKGYHKSALTFIFIDEGVDNGDIIMQREIPLTLEDTARTFYNKIIEMGKCMLNDITKYLDKKLKALSMYKSQEKHYPHTRSVKSVEGHASYRGNTVGMEAAECFYPLRIQGIDI
jgi:methionyl-tRNA formyltransferase|tara:strand:- start:673 stop:1389 length:717 start_codon:yes stop_codon:yes gene_type:complete